MRGREYMAVLQAVTEVMGEAVHIVDAAGKTILYNEAMAQLEKISVEDALGKSFRKVFSNIPEEESTLYQALVNRREIRNKQQTYLNIYGKQVTTINTTIPILVDDQVVAAMEVARDITEIKDMSDRILSLQDSRERPAGPDAGSGASEGAGFGNSASEIRPSGAADAASAPPAGTVRTKTAKAVRINACPRTSPGDSSLLTAAPR